uniref:Superoxide dismutase copper/zinc binding domain-containing protein n=1 Tax=Nothobranchius furzeri TaxID=105023 RepID=A0A8C6NST6_NOTFU
HTHKGLSQLLFSLSVHVQHARLMHEPTNEAAVIAVMNMQGVKGSFIFRQASPFDLTQINVNLTNLQGQVGPYHVHLFPVPSVRSDLCSNDNVGGHWNPFAINTTSPLYPNGSGKHMSLAGKNSTDDMFIDFNLPLFGANSIVGRSVVIHKIGGARFICASIGYPGEVNVEHVGVTYFDEFRYLLNTEKISGDAFKLACL